MGGTPPVGPSIAGRAIENRPGAALSPAARRWAMVGAMLVVEYVSLSLRVDSSESVFRGGAWEVLGRIGILPMIGIVVAATVLMIGTPGGTAPPAPIESKSVRPLLLLAHAVSFALFFHVTARVFGTKEAPPGSPFAWFALWAVLGGTSVVTLLAALVSIRGVLERVAPRTLLTATFIGAAAWGAADMSRALWPPLSLATLLVVAAELRAVFPDVVCDPGTSVIGVRDFYAEIGAPCSGIEGCALITLMLGGYLFALRRVFRFPRALLLVPIGVGAVWIGNTLRIASLVALGALTSAETAFGAFHSRAGWVFFCAVALGVGVFGRRSRYFRAPEDGGDLPKGSEENPTAAYVVPLLAMLAAAMVTGMLAPELDRFYGVRVAAGAIALLAYRRWFRDIAGGWSYSSVLFGLAVGAAWSFTARSGGAMAAGEAPGVLWIATHLLGSVLVVPVCEELAFRGYLLRWLVARDFTRVSPKSATLFAVLASSVAFGAIHERWAAAALAGAAFALIQRRTGRLMDAVVAHAACNAVVAAHVIATARWGLWG